MGTLGGEIEIAVGMERGRVRVARLSLKFGYSTAYWIELTDGGIAVAGIPDIAIGIGHYGMRPRAWRQAILFHDTGFRIQTSGQARPHTGPPDGTVWCFDWIACTLTQRRYRPFNNFDLNIAGDEVRPSRGVFRKVCSEIAGDRAGLSLWQLDHGGEQVMPLLRAAEPDGAGNRRDTVATGTEILYQRLSRAFGQRLRGGSLADSEQAEN